MGLLIAAIFFGLLTVLFVVFMFAFFASGSDGFIPGIIFSLIMFISGSFSNLLYNEYKMANTVFCGSDGIAYLTVSNTKLIKNELYDHRCLKKYDFEQQHHKVPQNNSSELPSNELLLCGFHDTEIGFFVTDISSLKTTWASKKDCPLFLINSQKVEK